jgi:prepilin-type N-terminal cleavage/methylation domain-containing protein
MENIMNAIKNNGFTLAEVLITLLIIGVISSIVIPGIIQDTQQAELKTTWKKTFSDLDQATKKIKLDNGGSLEGIFKSDDNIKSIYKAYLNNVKDCNYGTAGGNCWPATPLNYLDGTSAGVMVQSSLTLNNGVLLRFIFSDTNCNVPIGSSGINSCAGIAVDVNGFKGPNTAGKDNFGVWIMQNKIVPFGTVGDAGSYVGCTGTIGWGCSALYLYQ